MYKITAIKDGNPILITRLDIELDGSIFAVYYRDNKNRIRWDFPKDLDNLIIEYIGGSK